MKRGKAVILAIGSLPAAKAQPKEMLPIIDKQAIHILAKERFNWYWKHYDCDRVKQTFH